MPIEKIMKLFKDSMKQSEAIDGSLCFESLANIIMTYKIGGYGKEFFSGWLEKRKDKYVALKKKK